MAYAAIASLLETIHLILTYHQHSVSLEFKNQITSLHQHIIFLRSFLEDCPDEANNWEERICEVTNFAEDIIELYLSDSLLQSTVTTRPLSDELSLSDSLLDSTWGLFRRLFQRIAALAVTASHLFDQLLVSYSLLDSAVVPKPEYKVPCVLGELERAIKEIESIAEGVKERHKETVDAPSDDLTRIISLLCKGKSSLPGIMAIVGRGGIGKSTLARNAFNHPTIVEHFQIRAWVTVTQDFSRRGVLSSLLSSMNTSNAADLLKSEHELSTSIERLLTCKRYLIVLDDVRSRNVWDTFSLIFPSERFGSRIILTTRNSRVADMVSFRTGSKIFSNQIYIHQMNVMNSDQSWNLLRQKIFKGNPCPRKLEYMGKKMVGSCRGLPLAITVVSGILAVDRTEAVWKDIAENLETSNHFGDGDYLFQILYLSYAHLPHYLRPFLLYLGIFLEDHEIRVSKLIKLWVAEGLLNEDGSYNSSEERCEEYLEDLVRRSLIYVNKRKSDGRIKSCSINDLMKEMCLTQAHAENFFYVKRLAQAAQAIKKHERRVSIQDCDLDLLKNVYGSTIRTMICLEGDQQVLQRSLGYYRLLRILDLSNANNLLKEYDFPDQVFELFHLRYLAFGYPFNISEAISNLKNLQTLVVCPRKHKRQVVKLPLEIWRMPQLKHLVVLSCELPCQEEAMIPLEDLQTLSKAVDLICSKETLKMMPNLKKLCVTFTSWRDPGKDYDQLCNLIYLKELEVLKIKACDRLKKLPRISCPPFHPRLKRLSLKGLRLPWEDMKIVASLPNLKVLKLRNHACIGERWETSEGGFSHLTFLLIDRSDLKHWITKSSHFPKLKCLLLHHCWCMSEVPNEIGEIQTLELIQVDRTNKVQLQSAKRIQEDRQSLGNDVLQIHVV